MATASELAVAEELVSLARVAVERRWGLRVLNSDTFILTFPAKDGSNIQLKVDCSDYPVLPAAWHFRNPETGALDRPQDIPRGGSFFHGSGVICAPWNRLTYKPQGPHGDWQISDWRSNPKTGGARTLCAMALRIAVELQGPYVGRQG